MRKIFFSILIMGGLFSQAAFAGDPTYFSTIAEAQKYCPSLTNSSYDLTFKPNSPVEHSAGIISGESQNDSFFLSTNSSTLAPMHWDSQTAIIKDAQFRSVDGNYGHISGNKTTCYYSYQGWTGIMVSLLMSN